MSCTLVFVSSRFCDSRKFYFSNTESLDLDKRGLECGAWINGSDYQKKSSASFPKIRIGHFIYAVYQNKKTCASPTWKKLSAIQARIMIFSFYHQIFTREQREKSVRNFRTFTIYMFAISTD